MNRLLTAQVKPRQNKSLRYKFIRTLLLVAGIIGCSTLGIVGVMSAQASAEHLRSVQKYIEEGIASKGKVLTENHALALRGLTLDNAFLDMQRLVERAIKDDGDLVFGVYVSAERETLALARRPLHASDTTPERDAWRTLGLKPEELSVKSARIEHTRRFGQDLLEVAAPVVGEDGETLGTLRYGLSTKRMQDALNTAQAEASARLKRSFWLIGLLVSLAVAGGVLLSRAQAVKITQPIGALTRAAELFAAGHHDVRVNIQSEDELELLGASFNRMVEDLGTSYRNLEDMNRTLEQKVAARTFQLADKNRDMRLVLDNIDQGFVTLSADGVMAFERSRQVGAWFGEHRYGLSNLSFGAWFGEGEGQLPFWQYLARTNEAFAGAFELAWSQIADDFLPLTVCLDQLPGRLTHGKRTWSLRYLPFFRQERIEGVLVAIADITERLAREHEDAEHADLMQAFKHVVQDRTGFEVFLAESSELVGSICGHRLDDDPIRLKRALHTLKGTSGSMGLSAIAETCHQAESELAESDAVSSELVSALRTRWQTLVEHLSSSGLRRARAVEIPEKEYAELITLVTNGAASRRDIAQKLATFQAEPVEKAFRRLGDQAIALARRFGKGDLRVVIDSGDVRLDHERFGAFFGELVHLVRNAIDHGIESPEQRSAAGKPREGMLKLSATLAHGELRLELADDGAGIDWDSIRRAAQARGLPHGTDAELLDALCTDGVTTRAEVTAVSGRGVGMAALRQRVLTLKGTLAVESVRGRGTTWVLRFPAGEKDAFGVKSGIFAPRAVTPSLGVKTERG